ncbi:MAG: hypothetical protein M3144_11465, partial [Actinomycetota bacterium]|nr:hypothetical protein [Actinomycetota bacterium]
MAAPTASPEQKRDGTSPVLIVAGNLLVVSLLSFLISTVGDYDAENAARSAQTNRSEPASVG